MDFWVYIVKCADNSYYTGHTDNLEQRIAQHQQKYFPNCYTATRLPITLAFSQPFPTRAEALAAEQQIKGWSRKKKEAMLRGDWQEVSRLAKAYTPITATNSVHGEPVEPPPSTSLRTKGNVEGSSISVHPNSVHPELVEGSDVNGNASTVRTEIAASTHAKECAA